MMVKAHRTRIQSLSLLAVAVGALPFFIGAPSAPAEEPAPAGAPAQPDQSDRLLEIIEQLQRDPALLDRARQALESKLKAAEAAPAPDGAESVEAIRKRIDELGARVESLTTRLKSEQAELPNLRAALEQAKKADEPAATPAQPTAAPDAQAVALVAAELSGRAINFNRDIRPILSENCFTCHGPDKATRKADLRLDLESEAFKDLGDGRRAITPGAPDKSELIARVTTTDDADRMPPTKSGKSLTPTQVATLTEWVKQGAKWQNHWAFITPERPAVPAASVDSPANPIDAFIQRDLDRHALSPAPRADRRTLLRRLSLDLTGLPPTPAEINAFLGDPAPDAYEKQISRLLASPRFGENMARHWLDAARYADTHGYHIDSERSMWRWRDNVIDAYNANKPFNIFVTEQLAGDLLPDATLDQKIASGFNRNHMINYEGGAIPEEYLNNYLVDRVNTFGAVFFGMTFACAQCHDHKYDPVSQKDYYQLYAFFNSINEIGLDGRDGNAKPFIKAPLPSQTRELEDIDKNLASLAGDLRKPLPGLDPEQPDWEREWSGRLLGRWSPLDPASITAANGSKFEKSADLSIKTTGDTPDTDAIEFTAETSGPITALRLEALLDDSLEKPATGRGSGGNFILSEFEVEIATQSRPDEFERVPLALAVADYSQKNFEIAKAIDADPKTGWAVDGQTRREPVVAWFIPAEPIKRAEGVILRVRMRHASEAFIKHLIARFRLSVTSDPTLIPARLDPWFVSGPFKADTGDAAYKIEFEPEKSIDLQSTYEDGRYKWVERPDLADGPAQNLGGDVAATYLTRIINAPTERELTLDIGSNDAVKIWFNNEIVLDRNVERALMPGQERLKLQLKAGENRLLMKVVNYGAKYQFSFARSEERLGRFPFEIEKIFLTAADKRTPEQLDMIRNEFRRERWSEWPRLDREMTALKERRAAIEKSIPDTMIMAEAEKPRETFLLVRGAYDQPGEKVTPTTPAFLPPMPKDAPANRLGLAQWLTSREHPLTARVTINRTWKQLFGVGLVKTVEDFGAQGEWPSNPDLLDWLAVEFIESGWDMNHMIRLMVTSEAYMRESKADATMIARDPENRLLARGPRFRLDAEVIRDVALSAGGLLVEKIGGPSVRPYQPEGLWEEVAYGGDFTAQRFVQDKGEALYRRSMYTFWKRQSPPPVMLAFDAPNREVCVVSRSRTNTPLQALALLNGVQFVEAARALATRIIREGGPEASDRVTRGFELATGRRPNEREAQILMDLVKTQTEAYRSRPEDAKKLIGVGDSKADALIDPAELAAWTMLSSVILNLDETISKS